MMNAAEDKNYLYATDGDSVSLYHNNSAKLATSATGIAVTGAISGATNLGSVLQYKYLNFSYQQGTTSNTYSFVKTGGSTDFSIAMTPSSASSIIVMQLNTFAGVSYESGSTQQRAKIRFEWDIAGAGYNVINTFGYIGGYNLNPADTIWSPDHQCSWLFHKVSGTTSEITWKVGFAKMSSGHTGNFAINADYLAGSSAYMMEVTP